MTCTPTSLRDSAGTYPLPTAIAGPGANGIYPERSLSLNHDPTRDGYDKPSLAQVLADARPAIIAGPCAVESAEQIRAVALEAARQGAVALRGGTYKHRTAPGSFQGLGEEGVDLLVAAGREAGLPVVTEVLCPEQVEIAVQYGVDCLQVGARNSQNVSLLSALGQAGRPVLLKRGFGQTLAEFVGSIQYLEVAGVRDIILCERGIRTFETASRFTLDVVAVPWLKARYFYPVIVDPSHAAGVRQFVAPLALAGLGAGADGIIVEVHPDPASAKSDAAQQLAFDDFERLVERVRVAAGWLA